MTLGPIFSLLLATSTLAYLTPTNPSKNKTDAFNWHTTKSLIAFGDSYTYVQGTLGRPNYTFIGDNFNLSFTPEKLFTNRIVQNQTSTAEGGPNWVERLTGCGLAPNLTIPQTCKVQLWDFAYGGANTISDAAFTPPHWNHTVSFQQQIQQFVDYGNPAVESINLEKRDALIAVWIGINDINDLVKLRGKNATFVPLYEKVQSHVWKSVEQIYALGYKKFLVMNLPPLNRGPSSSLNASLVSTFNSVLKSHADTFQAAHEDSTVLQFDVNSVLNNVLDNYEDYGFKNITSFCSGYNQPDIESNPQKYGCGEGLETYFWYNSGHLTSRTHEVFTEVLKKWLVQKSQT